MSKDTQSIYIPPYRDLRKPPERKRSDSLALGLLSVTLTLLVIIWLFSGS